MQAFIECTLEMVQQRDFKNRETGDIQTKYRTWLSVDGGDMLEINSKQDYSKFKGKEGVAKIGIYEQNQEQGSGYWLSLVEFVPQDIE